MMTLICNSLVVSDSEHLFMCLFAICVPSSVKCLFRYFVHFLIRFFFLLTFEISLLHKIKNRQYYLEMHAWVVKLKHIKKIISMQVRIVVKARGEEGSCDQKGTNKGSWVAFIALP